MRFYVDHDLGALIRCWVAPDNPVAISRIYVTLEGRRVAELDAWLVDDVIRLQGWHSTGQCVFEITDAQAPGISQARRVELYDADTNVLIYRRSPRTDLIQAKVVLVDTSIIGDSAIQSVLFDHFQQSYFGVGTLSDEVLRVLFESPWMTSSFFSGLILMPRYEGSFVGDEILTTTLIHDPYVEMATRLLWLKARAAITADPAQAWRAGQLKEAVQAVNDYDFSDNRSLKRFFRMLPETAYRMLYNPLTRQFSTKLPDDRLMPGHSIVAIEVLARMGIVGHRDYFEAFMASAFHHIGIEAPMPLPLPIPNETLALAELLRGMRFARDMVVYDTVLSDAVRASVSKSWET